VALSLTSARIRPEALSSARAEDSSPAALKTR